MLKTAIQTKAVAGNMRLEETSIRGTS